MNFENYFQKHNLKKTPRVGIHYEQKTTPDLLWCVALSILDVTKNDRDMTFSDNSDIRKSHVFNSLMQDYFSKPPQKNTKNESNKVSSYQLGLLAHAGILEQIRIRPKKFRIANLEALEYMAVNDFNASKFLTSYTDNFLRDNNLFDVFKQYKKNPNQKLYECAKKAYLKWAKVNTAVKNDNKKHTYRVFNKIFNVFCYANEIPGQKASNIATGPCPYSYLIYRRPNFRDKDMPSGMTRNEYTKYREQVLSDIDQEGVVETLCRKAKKSIQARYKDSEIQDPNLGYIPDSGVHIHHILPRRFFQEYSLCRENLIALTPGQHLSSAHEKSNTRTINPKFQAICLRVKLDKIKISMQKDDGFYDYSKFISLIETCYGWKLSPDIKIKTLKKMLDDKIKELSN